MLTVSNENPYIRYIRIFRVFRLHDKPLTLALPLLKAKRGQCSQTFAHLPRLYPCCTVASTSLSYLVPCDQCRATALLPNDKDSNMINLLDGRLSPKRNMSHSSRGLSLHAIYHYTTDSEPIFLPYCLKEILACLSNLR